MVRVKITVLKTGYDEELAQQYGVDGLGRCPGHTVGQEYFVARYSGKPEGLCEEAWSVIKHYAFALVHGANEAFFDGVWMRDPGVAILTCNDGLRPVTFKVERVMD